MGRDLHYRPGSFYRQDDRTGFAQRAERTKKEWTGLIVDESVWEARQPQDLVKGVKDNQNVPEPRPLAAQVFVGPVYYQTAAAAVVTALTLVLNTVAGINVNDKVSVMLDNGVLFDTQVASINTATPSVTLTARLPYSAASGNLMIDYGPVGP